MSLRGNNFGRMDTGITIEYPVYGTAGSAEPSSWSTLKTCYAERIRKSGGETIQTNQQVATMPSDYKIRFDDTVTPVMRIYETLNSSIKYYIRDVQHWKREGFSFISTERMDNA